MSIPLSGDPLIAVHRNGHVESVHQIAACACNAEGELALAIGTIDEPVFVRSALKPIIAATVATAAADAGAPLKSEELAIISASHNAEAEHVAVVERLLARSGSSESDLLCGAVRARHAVHANKSTLYHNCSGKHAGLLLLCKLLGLPNANYTAANHPVNKAWLATVGRIYGIDTAAAPQGTDGCGLPVIALSLRTQAQGYARFATLNGLDECDRLGVEAVRYAMMEHPRLVGGVGHLDTKLMSAEPGKILAKIGAEGVHCAAVPAHDLALVLKVVDGNDRARPPAVVGLLEQLGVLSPRALDALGELKQLLIHNAAGMPVGDIRFLTPQR